MRISDWSSDVCSSDLTDLAQGVIAVEPCQRLDRRLVLPAGKRFPLGGERGAACLIVRQTAHAVGNVRGVRVVILDLRHRDSEQIGRASCRARVCQYVSISVVSASLKKKKNTQL